MCIRDSLEGKKTSSTQVGKTPSMYYENASVHCHLGVQEIEKDYVLRVSCANMSAYTEAAKQIQVFYDLYAQNNPEAKTIQGIDCLLYTSPSPRDRTRSRMPSSAWKKKKLQTQFNNP